MEANTTAAATATAQIPPSPATHTPPAAPAQAAEATPTAPHTPARPAPSAPSPQPTPTAAPLVKATAPPPPAPPATTPPVVDPADLDSTEAHLEKEVEALWQDHKQAKHSARKTNKELKLLRTNLARKLHELKNMLARPGCKGEWSSFLDRYSISRTTADRLVDAHQKSITPTASKCTTGATEEPMEDVVRRCLDRYWTKLSPMLATPEAVELFIVGLRDLAQEFFGVDADAPGSSTPDGTAETI